MKVKNKSTEEVEGLRYGAAMDAVTAGTHEIVNDEPVGGEAGSRTTVEKERERSYDGLTRAELDADAKSRDLDVAEARTKDDVIALLKADDAKA